jgi:hypothetical protein
MFGNLQFEWSNGGFTPVRNTTITARLSSLGLDIVFWESVKKEELTACVRGENIGMLLPRLLYDRSDIMSAGMSCPAQSRVDSVMMSKWLPTATKAYIAPERNRVPPWVFCVDTQRTRWYVDFNSLSAFGPSCLRGHDEILLQFDPPFATRPLAFVVHPTPGSNLLAELRASNMEVGTVNKVSCWPDRWYVGCEPLARCRYRAAAVAVERKDLAASGDWSLNIVGAPLDKKLKAAPERDTGGMER